MKKFLKRFPLTTYSVIIVILILTGKDVDYDSRDPRVIWNLCIVLLSLPLIGIGQIYPLLGITASLPWAIPTCFLLDLTLLYLHHLIPAIRGKNKSLLIPKLNLSSHRLLSGLFGKILKVLSKSRNGKS